MKKSILALLLFSIISFTIEAQVTNKVEGFIVKGENASMIPLKRIDSLRIGLISDDTLAAEMLSNYIDIEKDYSKAGLIIFTKTQLYEDYVKENMISSTQISLLIEDDSITSNMSPDIVVRKSKADRASDAIQFIFGAAKDNNSNGDFRLGFGDAEEVGLDYMKMKCQIDSIAHYALSMGVSPGLQVLVARYGMVVFHETYGYHTYDSIQKVKKDDIYDWASVTKITSALPAIMKLHDEDKFDLDANIGTYLPYFKHGNKKDLIFRRILSHNAGLQPWIPFWKTSLKRNGKFKRETLSYEQSDDYSTQIVPGLFLHEDYRKKIYKQIRKSEVNKVIHPEYTYSGLTFYIFPEIVETLSSEDYQNYLNENFYNPLGAGTVGYLPLNRFDKDRIVPTEIDTFFRKTEIHGTVHDEGAAMMKGVSANAGLFGSTLDLAKIMQMYLWEGKYGGERYISENTINKFTFAHYANEGNKRGLGFDKPNLENREDDSCSPEASMSSFGHGGYTGTYTWADPESGILFVFMSNRVYPTRDNRLLYELGVRPSMHRAVYDAIIE
ncbi:MAG: beta-lactamase family protein [Bacteroidales bacterium]|nr:beta-lactamase family protein [Bacteroidales bacterium]MCF8405944.1 beta-lactamase family protein [Bacteroidales bacterium]